MKLYISEENLGNEATQEQAEQVISLLQAREWPVEYGSSINNDWGNVADIIKELFDADFYTVLNQVS